MTQQTFAHQVVDFNQQVLKIEQRKQGFLDEGTADISVSCLQEELDEFKEALETRDLIGQVDALIDLQYFATGIMYKLGLTPEQINQCQTAVHEANMEKKLGVNAKRGDGETKDAVKPEGWISPEQRIGSILEA